jgi:hypothetical protein
MTTVLSDITDVEQSLTKFWVRTLGFSKEFSRIKVLAQLSFAERLLAALLRNDSDAAQKILDDKERSSATLADFIKMVRAESLGCIVFERIIALNLSSHFAQLEDGSALSQLRMMSLHGASNHYQLEQKFAGVLSLTNQYQSGTFWVKGAHLSRTVYEPSYFRHYGDLDVIVDPSVFASFVEALKSAGFASFHTPAYCNQIGVGPVKMPADLLAAPCAGWIPVGPVTMRRETDGVFVDIKVGPFDRGVQAIELDRMFIDAEKSSCLDQQYLGPSLPDHLMIMLCNLAKNRFKTWRTILDIHMLALALNKSPLLWHKFVECCKKESIATTAWVGLCIATDRLNSAIPHSVLQALQPKRSFGNQLFSFTLESAYVWNSTSLPMMILNSFASPDRARKLDLLSRSFFPSTKFLSDYYGNGSESGFLTCFRYLPRHWFVLVMPGGLIRRTLGRLWFSSESSF